MYLKSLEMIGFKSFADKTKLEFEPGMTAIVGPNGCGKSNISDAIRWVIGEQSAKALRGSKMEDCIFNGTDSRKPHAMAEVSITFAECEQSLGTEFNEMTVTRRVFRSGEGAYFINKTPCRLKDIQRLFMDTGVGTVSYSLMEQGRIDRVLSSHPEDRRTIFEEASGITKFKADKTEALRKLEYTEANLLRLADVIREVKRQIGSLQRQAGKARSYKTLRDELKKLDVYTTRENLGILDSNISKVESRILEFSDKLRDSHSVLENMEKQASEMREALMQTERDTGLAQEAGGQAQAKLDHMREMIATNRQRIDEYTTLSRRDTNEIEESGRQLADKRGVFEQLTALLEKVKADQAVSEKKLKEVNENFSNHRQQIDSTRSRINEWRAESVELDSMFTRMQNQLLEIEASQRSAVIQRERLSAEKSQLSRIAGSYDKRQSEMGMTLETMQQESARRKQALELQISDRQESQRLSDETRAQLAELQSQLAAKRAQADMLTENNAAEGDFAEGARHLLAEQQKDPSLRGKIVGTLAESLDIDPPYRTALEAALRCWLDAIIVKDSECALQLLEMIESGKAGAARIIAADLTASPASTGTRVGVPLTKLIRCDASIAPAVARLVGNVSVVDSLAEVPRPVPASAVFVTRNGSVVRGDGCMEFWMTDNMPSNPLSRKHALLEAKAAMEEIERQAAERSAAFSMLGGKIKNAEQEIRLAQEALSEWSRSVAQKEGENQLVSEQATEAKQRLETVSFELQNIDSQAKSGDGERETILKRIEEIRAQRERTAADVAKSTRELQVAEARHSELQAEVTQQRIDFSGLSQRFDNLTSQLESVSGRIKELEAAIEGRSAGIKSYQSSIESLSAATKTTEEQLSGMEEMVKTSRAKVDGLHQQKAKQAHTLAEHERALSARREEVERCRSEKGDLDVRHAESRMRRQNQVERVTSEYSITLEQLLAEPVPEWEGGTAPALDACETKVAELRTKIEAMGPVNLVAIEEYQELEQRYAFLTNQEQDLIKSKQQLMEMIRTINKTTSEMFSKTFVQVNENFQNMFGKLFNGGTAKLVLVNDEDVLECGIEIIARPPGKRLQNVSLLSGGERTLTAVALLFAIYLIKPSPFCLLDELDAALDESNIGRFVTVLKEFLHQSQFVVITHNRQTIATADVLYGVTMHEKGISGIVSMKFNEYIESGMDRRKAVYPGSASHPDPVPAGEPEKPNEK